MDFNDHKMVPAANLNREWRGSVKGEEGRQQIGGWKKKGF